jgi:GTPase KRas
MSKEKTGNNLESYKIAVCGGGGVGKSCLTIQFVQNQFIETWDPTIEDSYTKQIKLTHQNVEHNMMLNILDTAGQEEYKALRDEYMRAGDGFLMVFDLTSEKTFTELEQFRTQIQRSKDTDFPPIVVVGNKSDLPEDLKFSGATKRAKELCEQWKVKYVETSAKNRSNIDESFNTLVLEILNKNSSNNNNTKSTKKGNGGCLIL